MAHQQNHNYASPLRYPGGKGILANFIKLIVSQNALLDGHYVEVYAGGAGIAWSLLFEEYVTKVHINDLNKAVIAFWGSVLEDTEALCRLIKDTPVNMEQWFKQRAVLSKPELYSRLELGFSTFFLNRTNRSGILRGGVIGGKEQTGEWKIDARFNKDDLIRRIQRIAKYSNRVSIYNLDAAEFMQTILPDLPPKTLVYLDPPYYHNGQDLYENHYNSQDHTEIEHLVSNISQPWLVSYDGCPEIDLLYERYPSIRYSINYSARNRYAGSETIFFSEALTIPEVANPIKIKSVARRTKPLF